jgi:hypothetical protein
MRRRAWHCSPPALQPRRVSGADCRPAPHPIPTARVTQPKPPPSAPYAPWHEYCYDEPLSVRRNASRSEVPALRCARLFLQTAAALLHEYPFDDDVRITAELAHRALYKPVGGTGLMWYEAPATQGVCRGGAAQHAMCGAGAALQTRASRMRYVTVPHMWWPHGSRAGEAPPRACPAAPPRTPAHPLSHMRTATRTPPRAHAAAPTAPSRTPASPPKSAQEDGNVTSVRHANPSRTLPQVRPLLFVFVCLFVCLFVVVVSCCCLCLFVCAA